MSNPESRSTRPRFVPEYAAECLQALAPEGLGAAVNRDDLIASKMTALVERGAPRDLRDIHAICAAGLAVPSECWRLWAQRSKAAGAEPDRERAVLAIQTHLARIAWMRPLGSISDQAQRSEAQSLRIWFPGEFLPAAAEAGS